MVPLRGFDRRVAKHLDSADAASFGVRGEGVRVSGRRHGANLGGEQAVFCGCPSWFLKENPGEKPKSLWGGPNPARKAPPFWAVCRSLEAKAAGEGPKTRPTAFQGSKAWNRVEF